MYCIVSVGYLVNLIAFVMFVYEKSRSADMRTTHQLTDCCQTVIFAKGKSVLSKIEISVVRFSCVYASFLPVLYLPTRNQRFSQ